MKHIKIAIYINLLMCCISCTKDLGNYEYKELNEVTISNLNEVYGAASFVDTLVIYPKLNMSQVQSENDFEFLWLNVRGLFQVDTISKQKDLVFPVNLEPYVYTIRFFVINKATKVQAYKDIKLDVGTSLSKGILVMGENRLGNADIDMISMVKDTLIAKDLLSGSGLPALRGPLAAIHTAYSLSAHPLLWAMTESGSYYLDRVSFKGSITNNFQKRVFTNISAAEDSMIPVYMAPEVNGLSVGSKADPFANLVVTKSGNLFYAHVLTSAGEYYANPINVIAANPKQLLKAAPFVFYSFKSTNAMVWYDMTNERFMRINGMFYIYDSVPLTDGVDEPFSWDQKASGRTLVYGENTANTDNGGIQGNSFALMKDKQNNYCIYKFYANANVPIKMGMYAIQAIAGNIARASSYAFCSSRSLLFYVVDGELYAYNYNPGNERLYQLTVNPGSEITMIKYDNTMRPNDNSLLIGSYNPNDRGVLQRFKLGNDQNTVTLVPVQNEKWKNLVKIKSIAYRNAN